MSVKLYYHLESLRRWMTFTQSFVILFPLLETSVFTIKMFILVMSFSTLFSTSNLKDKDTIKVVFLQDQEPTITLTLTDVTDTDVTNMTDQPWEEHYIDDTSSVSTNDTLILSSSEDSPGHRSRRWPAQFPIPSFSGLTEIQIQSANERLFSLQKISFHYSQTSLEN